MAAPMTYTLDNEQYIAVMAGLGGAASLGNIPQHAAAYERVNNGRILAFKIGGGDTPKPPMRKAIPVPQPPEQHGDEASIKAGHKLFLDYCDACHNNNESSLLPDLRRLTAEKHGIFNSIVLDGAFVQLGMPRFEDLTVDDAEAIHAYLINETQLAFEQQQLEQ
jgi:quinohemoprotein ethanol dehydrogenase